MQPNGLGERLKRFRALHPEKERATAGERLPYLKCGKGGRITVLLAGLFGRGESWFPLIERLQGEYRFIAPTCSRVSRLHSLRDALLALLDEEGCSRAAVLGHSFGGMIAQWLVESRPDRFQWAIFSHTTAPDPALLEAVERRRRLLERLPAWLNRLLWRHRIRRWSHTLRGSDSGFWGDYRKELLNSLSRQDFSNSYHQFVELLKAPGAGRAWRGKTLILESDDDPVIRRQERMKLRSCYPGARVHTFSGTGHSSLQVRPREYCSVVHSFLQRDDGSF